MKIAIFASIWAHNLWDELILKNEIKMLESEYWIDTQFTVFSYDYKNPFLKQKNIVYKEYFPIWVKNFFNIFRNIKNFFSFIFTTIVSDFIVIWWWWIIYDWERQSTKEPLGQWLFRTNIFRLFSKKVIFYSVWITVSDKSNYSKIKKIFTDAYKISVRNDYSFNLLKELWILSTIVEDPVFFDIYKSSNHSFMIKSVKAHKFSFKDLEDIDLKWKKIAIAFREWYLSDKGNDLHLKLEEWKINELINYILWKWWKVLLLPHSFHKTDFLANDYVFLNNFIKKWKDISIVSSMKDVYKAYIKKEFDICLAMRLHSIILSQVYEIPFIWVSYSVKTDEVLKELSDLKELSGFNK